jgi:hypothetical protein
MRLLKVSGFETARPVYESRRVSARQPISSSTNIPPKLQGRSAALPLTTGTPLKKFSRILLCRISDGAARKRRTMQRFSPEKTQGAKP